MWGGRTNIAITLKSENTALSDVVVIGYGTMKKSDVTGSVVSIDTKSMMKRTPVNVAQALQGAAAGVMVTSQDGAPGSNSAVRIRGIGTINGDAQPLYVVDGVQVGSSADFVNPSDIESIEVLKDASATAIYGSAGANGVIMITTKHGQKGKANVTVTADWGIQTLPYKLNTLTGDDYARSIRDSKANDGAGLTNQIWSEAYDGKRNLIDWQDQMYRTSLRQQYGVSASGGTENTQYNFSVGYLNNKGIIVNTNYDRITARGSLKSKVNKYLELGADMNYMYSTVKGNNIGLGNNGNLSSQRDIAQMAPSLDYIDPATGEAVHVNVVNPDGTYGAGYAPTPDGWEGMTATAQNPYASQMEIGRVTRNSRISINPYIDLTLLKTKQHTLNAHTIMSWTQTNSDNDEFSGMYKRYNNVGNTVSKYEGSWVSASAYDFLSPNNRLISLTTNAKSIQGNGGFNAQVRTISYYGRLVYNLFDRYILTATLRRDGSSNFSSGNRWGTFPSVALAWRAKEETFLKNVKEISNAKVRFGWGQTGNAGGIAGRSVYALSSAHTKYNFYELGAGGGTTGQLTQETGFYAPLVDTNLKWETNYNLNLGLDFALFDRVNVTLEYYLRNTKNLLMDSPVSMTTGFSSYLMNVGQLRNQGVELEINSTNIKNKNFEWKTTFNLSHNTNKVVNLDGDQTEIISGTQIHKIGHSYRTFYMIEFAGINPENGNPQFYTNDLLEDGTYSKEITEDATKAKSIMLDKHAEPNITGGLYNSFRYKWFDLSFLFNYQFGGYSYDTWAQKTEHGGYDMEANIPTYYADSWKNPGDITKYECFYDKSSRVAMHKITNSRRLHSTDYFRLKTLTFGFTLPKQWLSSIGLSNARIYMSANNLWTWAAWDYYDPESVVNGSATQSTPPLKTVTFGLNLNF